MQVFRGLSKRAGVTFYLPYKAFTLCRPTTARLAGPRGVDFVADLCEYNWGRRA